MKIVFLVINYMPHQLISINTLIEQYDAEVHSISFKENTKIPKNSKHLRTYKLKDFSRLSLLKMITNINPELLIVAGWAVSDFVWVSKKIKRKLEIPVVSYSDSQWKNTWKQKINCLLSPYHLKKAFSHLWIAGIYQYEYARKLGFKNEQIIYNSLSCDLDLFKQVRLEQKESFYPKKFIFIGRFVPVKGLDMLLDAWAKILDKKGWSLLLIGEGPQKSKFLNIAGVSIKDYVPHKELIKEIEHAGCLVLPSVFESWALVIHEAAAAGLPIIATNVCGAAPHFVVSGYNGYQVQGNSRSIQLAMEKIINMNSKELFQFSIRSRELSETISPKLGSAQIMSIINS